MAGAGRTSPAPVLHSGDLYRDDEALLPPAATVAATPPVGMAAASSLASASARPGERPPRWRTARDLMTVDLRFDQGEEASSQAAAAMTDKEATPLVHLCVSCVLSAPSLSHPPHTRVCVRVCAGTALRSGG
jgi:hypothetical protein